MERVKVNLPDNFSFSVSMPIRITDLNFGGHVGNDSFLALVHEARHRFLEHHGYSEMNFENTGLIMADAAIEYKRELSASDNITIYVAAGGFDKYGFDIFYKIEITNNNQAAVLAGKIKTGMLCYDYNNKKLAPLPEAAKEKLA